MTITIDPFYIIIAAMVLCWITGIISGRIIWGGRRNRVAPRAPAWPPVSVSVRMGGK